MRRGWDGGMMLTCLYCSREISAETGREMSEAVRNHTLNAHHRTDAMVITEALVKLEAAAARYPYEEYLKDICK
jgi:hypothetical protein